VLTFVRPARKTLRFLLQTAVTFWWTNGNGEARQGEGRSRDVSEHGAFVFASSCPPVGASVVLKIDLEGIPDEIGRLPVEVEGEVLRAEQCPAERGMLTRGFAVQY
jgi:PilZ domain-containing protein